MTMMCDTIASQMLVNMEMYARGILDEIFEQIPNLRDQYSPENVEKSLQDLRYHIEFLAQSISLEKTSLFSEYKAWVYVVLESRGLPRKIVDWTFSTMREFLTRQFPECGTILDSYFSEPSPLPSQGTIIKPNHIMPENPRREIARQYLKALLDADRVTASEIIHKSIENGVSLKDIYLYVFQPVQHEIGNKWMRNEISVAQEHYETAVTQMVISQLYPHIFKTPKIGKTLVATCIGGELHEIGVRMIADFFEMSGWDTYYLGANTPLEAIIDMLIKQSADVLAISATMTTHLGRVRRLIQAIRESESRGVKIIVGGYPFNLVPTLWMEIDADGWAPDAEAAVKMATSLVKRANDSTR